jgi:hypothetical protein
MEGLPSGEMDQPRVQAAHRACRRRTPLPDVVSSLRASTPLELGATEERGARSAVGGPFRESTMSAPVRRRAAAGRCWGYRSLMVQSMSPWATSLRVRS